MHWKLYWMFSMHNFTCKRLYSISYTVYPLSIRYSSKNHQKKDFHDFLKKKKKKTQTIFWILRYSRWLFKKYSPKEVQRFNKIQPFYYSFLYICTFFPWKFLGVFLIVTITCSSVNLLYNIYYRCPPVSIKKANIKFLENL